MGKTVQFPTKAVPNSVSYSKRITIDSVKGNRVSEGVTFTDVLNLCLNAIVSNAFNVVAITTETHAETLAPDVENRDKQIEAMRRAVTEHLYDLMNSMFSSTLEAFAPEIAKHPGLTELAIMKAEDEIVAAYLEGLPEEEREAATKAAMEIADQSRRALLQKIADKAAEEAALEFVPATEEQILEEDRKRAVAVLKQHNIEEDSVIKEELDWASLFLLEHPLPCMTPAVEPGEVPTYEVTPTKEDLANCDAVCSQCTNEPCVKVIGAAGPYDPIGQTVTPAAKILDGLE